MVGSTPILRNIIETGSNKGVHFFGWWLKVSKMKQQAIGFGSDDIFNTKIFLKVDERTVQSETSAFVKWQHKINRALLYDEIEYSEPITFIPFSNQRKEKKND